MKSLYHYHPAIRLSAARESSDAPTVPDEWQPFWSGVANPWLVFLGPSPGNSPGQSGAAIGCRLPTLGAPHPHVEYYVDSNGFWTRIREWSHQAFLLAGVFRDRNDSLSSILVGNILSVSQGDSGKIAISDLHGAVPCAAKNIRWLQPRVVVTMDKRISKALVVALTRQGMTLTTSSIQTVPAKSQSYSHYKPRSWDLACSIYKLRIVESPQHPTKRNFYDSAVIDKFLAAHIREVLQADESLDLQPLGGAV